MTHLSRRRFISIMAGLPALAGSVGRAAQADTLFRWRGIALGAEAEIWLDHPRAAEITDGAAAEIARLEAIFSLTRNTSALSRLNAVGQLDAPPFELLECLALSGRVHAATGGLFDPTVQPLWALYARTNAQGRNPAPDELAQALGPVGWSGVSFDESAIRLRPGASLTLNGIAQGFIADRIADFLRAQGLTDVLVNTGEFRALGTMPDGEPWPVQLAAGGMVGLSGRALASSAPLGTTFDQAGQVGHILNPATGLPAPPQWRLVSISAPSAAVADGLSTAACLMPDRSRIVTALTEFPDARLEHLA